MDPTTRHGTPRGSLYGYKYLGILEYNEVLYAEMKIRLQNEYYRRLKRILKSKLNGKNVIMEVNTWAVSVLGYGAGVIKWTKAEPESIDRKTRNPMTIYGMLHPRADLQRFYLPRGQGGRGLLKGRCLLLLLRIRSAHLQVLGFPIANAY